MSHPDWNSPDVLLDAVELLDPDWRDHFREVEDAAENYRTYVRAEWDAALAEVVGVRDDGADCIRIEGSEA